MKLKTQESGESVTQRAGSLKRLMKIRKIFISRVVK